MGETAEALARRDAMIAECEALYDQAKETAAKALWTRGVEKASKLALLYALSENPDAPLVDAAAVDWGWRVVEHLTKRMLFQASAYVHDNEFDALRQKAIRLLRTYGDEMKHGRLLRLMHVDADTLRRVVETLVESELVRVTQLSRGGAAYSLRR